MNEGFMCKNAGCPVGLSEDAVLEVVLRNKFYVVRKIVGVAISLLMFALQIHKSISNEILR